MSAPVDDAAPTMEVDTSSAGESNRNKPYFGTTRYFNNIEPTVPCSKTLSELFEEYKPDLLIADGSNAPWSSYRWEKTCKKYKVPFYDTRKKGGLKINLGNEE